MECPDLTKSNNIDKVCKLDSNDDDITNYKEKNKEEQKEGENDYKENKEKNEEEQKEVENDYNENEEQNKAKQK